ncbi:MAG: hypothetical protein HY001_04035 [Candidatus Portnoybacteria bacterium]|nr:hypothetical protein [Candidatus Portnoybacteria bacterium]
MNPEKLQPIPPESAGAPAKEEATAFEAFGRRGQKSPDGQEKKEPQIEAEKTIALAREAEEAFSRNDFSAALEKLRELQRAASPEGVIEGEYHEQLLKEFERQVATVTRKEYSEASGMKPDEYRKIFEPLKERIREIAQREKETKEGHIPFVIVIKNDVVGAEKGMPLIELEGKKGYTTMSADEIKGSKPIEGVKIPNGNAYLAIDIDTGKTTLGKTPDEAIKKIKQEDRSPLTIDEAVALITHQPEILKDHYVWAPGSRLGGGEVAYLWLDEGKPRLYWSWADSSHAKWGSASCGSRVGP